MEVAGETVHAQGDEVTQSRLAVITGIHRRDISRLLQDGADEPGKRNLIMKVVGQWQSDPNFVSKKKKPKPLTVGFDGSDFSGLIRRVSKDLNPATVLFELERVGAVEVSDGIARLTVGSYVPRGDIEAGFRILSDDVADLMAAVDQNLTGSPPIPNLHLRTEYDRVRADALPLVRQWLVKEGHDFHLRARQFLSTHDQDVSPDLTFDGRAARVVLGSYSLVEDK